MTPPVKPTNKKPADAAPADLANGTVRIEHDRKRLAMATLASGVAALIVPGMFFVGILHPPRIAPEWTFVPLSVAVLFAAIGFLRSIIRLQDGDPALVLSPRGLDFRPSVFGEIVRIPWNAIRGFKLRSYKQQRFIVLQVDDIDRYAPRVGFAGFLRRIFKRRAGADEISFSTPMAKSAWNDLESLLRRYLEQYGRPDATTSTNASNARAGVGAATPRSLQSRSLP